MSPKILAILAEAKEVINKSYKKKIIMSLTISDILEEGERNYIKHFGRRK